MAPVLNGDSNDVRNGINNNNNMIKMKMMANNGLECPSISIPQGFLTDANCPLPIHIKTQPISEHYDCETRPFARGKFAQVRRCVHKESKIAYAAKVIKKRRRSVDVRHEIMHEIRVLLLASNRCEHIVKLHEVYETEQEFILLLEMAEGGELQKVLDEEEFFSEHDCRRLIKQIILGLQFLHRSNIVHLDIKPQNLLLTSASPDGDVKLCDFGVSRLLSDGTEVREIVGTPAYVSPEILQFEPIQLATDMWSLGILAYVLLSGHSPFGGDNKQETFCNITNSTLDFPPCLFEHVSEQAKDFIRQLLVRDPEGRMTCEECLDHEWLAASTPDENESLNSSSNGVINVYNKENCNDDSISNNISIIYSHNNKVPSKV